MLPQSVGKFARWWKTCQDEKMTFDLALKKPVPLPPGMLDLHLSLPDYAVDKVGIAVELILNDVVEDLEQEEDQMVVGGRGEEKPRSGEGLQQVDQLAGRYHG